MRSPFFVIGSPRSGTTLLRLILTCHSKVIVPPECGFVLWLSRNYSAWTFTDSLSSSKRLEFLLSLERCRKFDMWGIEIGRIEKNILSTLPTNYAELVSCVFFAYATMLGKSPEIWGDKNNFYVDHISELNSLFPSARFIHIVRDGRDIACSYREIAAKNLSHPYAPRFAVDIEKIAKRWSTDIENVEHAFKSMPETSKTIRYEDLVTTSISLLAELLDWLGLEPEQDMLSFYEFNAQQTLEPPEMLQWKEMTINPISGVSVARYRSELTGDEIAQFEDCAYSSLERYGYLR